MFAELIDRKVKDLKVSLGMWDLQSVVWTTDMHDFIDEVWVKELKKRLS